MVNWVTNYSGTLSHGTTSVPVTTYLDDPCKCGCKRMDHRKGAKAYGACRMCLTCHKFKIPKPAKQIKSKTRVK